jgi:hypothetical protein
MIVASLLIALWDATLQRHVSHKPSIQELAEPLLVDLIISTVRKLWMISLNRAGQNRNPDARSA